MKALTFAIIAITIGFTSVSFAQDCGLLTVNGLPLTGQQGRREHKSV